MNDHFLNPPADLKAFMLKKMKSVCPSILERIQGGFNIREILDKRCFWKAKVQGGIS